MKTTHNYVANDLIWKDHISKEFTAAGQWDEKWGFLASFIADEINSQEQEQKNDRPNQTDSNSTRQPTKSSGKSGSLKLPPIQNCGTPHKSSKPFPQTTSQFVGWKAKDSKNSLEKYGRYTKPTKTFLKEMNWPYEAMA